MNAPRPILPRLSHAPAKLRRPVVDEPDLVDIPRVLREHGKFERALREILGTCTNEWRSQRIAANALKVRRDTPAEGNL